MADVQVEAIRFVRVVRTDTSEVFILWEGESRIGQLDVHYAHDLIHATLVLEREIPTEGRVHLVNQIDDELISSYLPHFDREDFLVTVYLGRELDSFSDATLGYDDELDLEEN